MPSDAPADFDGYVQRAELLADLGQYDDAVAELGSALTLRPDDLRALTLLARVHLAAHRPEAALAVTDTALAAAGIPSAAIEAALIPADVRSSETTPVVLGLLAVRGYALVDLRRFAEAARVADGILATAPDDPYALRSGAAIRSESRNGQPALNAAWRAVELAPEEPQAHLVLAVVAARLELFDLAERAYREALRLDPGLAEAEHDVGVVGLERRRHAVALAALAEATPITPVGVDSPRTAFTGIVRLVVYGAGYSLIAAVIIAFMSIGGEGVSRFWAALAAVAGFVVVGVLAARVPGPVTELLRAHLRNDRVLALAVVAAAAAPALFLVYAVVGTPWPLVAAIVATAVAELTVLTRIRA
ncbi:MAG TPA: tetratricopeptide repeat protein [Micromonosporaceae bacterium]